MGGGIYKQVPGKVKVGLCHKKKAQARGRTPGRPGATTTPVGQECSVRACVRKGKVEETTLERQPGEGHRSSGCLESPAEDLGL